MNPKIMAAAALAILLAGKIMADSARVDVDGRTANVEQNLLINGDFSKPIENGRIAGWKTNGNVKIVDDRGTVTLQIDGGGASASQIVPIATDWKKLKLEMKMRITDVVPGDENWKDARLAMCFKDKNGNRAGDWPNVFHGAGTTDGWLDCVREYLIPKDAVSLEINPANFGSKGRVEFQNIRLTLVSKRLPLADSPVPDGAGDPWNFAEAWREKSSTREKICLNGLWRVFPVLKDEQAKEQPKENLGWGWFKVPSIWEGEKRWDLSVSAQEPILPDGIIEYVLSKTRKYNPSWFDEGGQVRHLGFRYPNR